MIEIEDKIDCQCLKLFAYEYQRCINESKRTIWFFV